jgi:hypothetical protein
MGLGGLERQAKVSQELSMINDQWPIFRYQVAGHKYQVSGHKTKDTRSISNDHLAISNIAIEQFTNSDHEL